MFVSYTFQVAALRATLTTVHDIKIVHFQSQYLVTNCSSADVLILPVCSGSAASYSSTVYEMPEVPITRSVWLPTGTSKNL